MIYNIFLTRACNLCCEYCGSCRYPTSLPNEITYSLKKLKNFIEKDKNASIAFYGGEPTLRIDLMKEIMDNFNVKHYIIQTNGTRLNKIPVKYLQKLSIILVSLDGDEKITDLNRGKGTHERVIKNLRAIRPHYPGKLISRMTLTEPSNVYNDVKWFLNNDDPSFDGIHWQINFMFDDINKWNNLEDWIEHYNSGINKLIDEWVSEMENNSIVQRIYPFMTIARSLLLNEPTKLRCGAGWIYHTIDTNGNILACPIAGEMTSFWIDNINNIETPSRLRDAFSIKNEPCISCNIFDICGGRCLFANYVKPWGDDGYRIICKTIRNLIEKLISVKPKIEELIRKKIINMADFDYIRYSGVEEIP
ncbi:MAG: TIGR04084 family radical SAM/SPASM domain-containing protein [Candidatus Lokiarchaeota archaeon]|nr:TIGR04084 family radical SAM/SPASM domain-containing protein [Candidatus Lokiarchaeota archaeon]